MTLCSSNNEYLHNICCTVGQKLCATSNHIVPGHGTYVQAGHICSSLNGRVKYTEKENFALIEVVYLDASIVAPSIGDVVIARVTQVTERVAICSILCIGEHKLKREYKGIIRKGNVRPECMNMRADNMNNAFQPNDIILARVLSKKNLFCHHLTTADEDLGVIIAISKENSVNSTLMLPVSWHEMECPKTRVKEPRKVAKITPKRLLELEALLEKHKNE